MTRARRAERALPVVAAACAAIAAGGPISACGGGSDGEPSRGERRDAPADPGSGWRTVTNGAAGFTIAAPQAWVAKNREKATLIRSRNRLVAVTVAADRSRPGRELDAKRYARQALEELPGFEGSVAPAARRVRGTPYSSARVDGVGSVRTSRTPQRITIAAYHLPRQITYAVVVFRNASVPSPRDERAIDRLLRSLRAGSGS